MLAKFVIGIQLLLACYSWQKTCPDTKTSTDCTDSNKCTTCTLRGEDHGCKYCNYEWYDDANYYCYWNCVECQEGYTLTRSDHDWYGSSWCEKNHDAETTTTETPKNEETCTWEWWREYIKTNRWFNNPSFTFYGECSRYTGDTETYYSDPYEIDAKTSVSLVLSSIKVDGADQSKSGQWAFECSRNGDCNDQGQYGGVAAYINKLSTIGIDLDVAIFSTDGTATINDNDVSVSANSLKFGLSISNDIDFTETLEVCIDNWVYTWRANQANYSDIDAASVDSMVLEDDTDKTTRFSVNSDGGTVKIGEYAINNDLTAQCIGYDDISVEISTEYNRVIRFGFDDHGSQSFGKATICYTFPYCESGNILYDPFVYYEGESDAAYSPISIQCIISCVLALIMFYQ